MMSTNDADKLSQERFLNLARVSRTFLLNLVALSCFVAIVVWIATAVYAILHYHYMPPASDIVRTRDVNFVFIPCNLTTAKCSFLTSNISLAEDPLWPHQSYSIELDLVYPIRQPVHPGGMILICTSMYSVYDNRMTDDMSDSESGEICKSILVPSISEWRYELVALLYLPLEIVGLVSPLHQSAFAMSTSTIVIKSAFRDIDDPETGRLDHLKFEIKSRFWDIHSATLNIYVHYAGLRQILHRHPILSFVVSVSCISGLLFCLFFFCYKTLLIKLLTFLIGNGNEKERLTSDIKQLNFPDKPWQSMDVKQEGPTIDDKLGDFAVSEANHFRAKSMPIKVEKVEKCGDVYTQNVQIPRIVVSGVDDQLVSPKTMPSTDAREERANSRKRKSVSFQLDETRDQHNAAVEVRDAIYEEFEMYGPNCDDETMQNDQMTTNTVVRLIQDA